MTEIDNEKYPNYSGDRQTNKNSNYEVNRLSLAEEEGRRRGGRRNEEASTFLFGEAGTDEIKRGNFEAVAERQEQTLEHWAKKEGIWFDINLIRAQPFIGRGEEASVYEDNDPAYVDKVMFYQVFSIPRCLSLTTGYRFTIICSRIPPTKFSDSAEHRGDLRLY
ncbi:hypothetical protein Barb6XT_01941 [Bacteroidales bacterium Barb6XT]|nr:hypothetical protein Barb6XT_01941 [Bacteroidales bacterium Barb6XT]